MLLTAVLAAYLLLLPSCAPKKTVIKVSEYTSQNQSNSSDDSYLVSMPENTLSGASANIMPKATVFRMSGDYADNVAVTFAPDGTLTYFPAPSDISPDCASLSLGDGWYLNRQGFGPNSVFTRWTFDEYSKLPSVPSPEEIKEALIPGARVTQMQRLNVSISDAEKMSASELLKLIQE